ncbi:MAG: DUF167 domain-containing protein [bacterium]
MLIKVKVFPKSKENEIIKKDKDSFEARVKAEPRMGLANKEVVDTLSFYFKAPKSKIRLVKGFRERNKIFEILD